MTEPNSNPEWLPCRYLERQVSTTSAWSIRSTPTCLCEDLLGTTETVRPGDTDGEPYHAKEEVDHVEQDRPPEHAGIPPGRKVADSDSQTEDTLRDSPDECPPLDVVVADTSGKADLVDSHFGYDVIGRGLRQRSDTWRGET